MREVSETGFGWGAHVSGARHLWPVHGEDEIAAVERVLRSGKTNYHSGDEGRLFEDEWAKYVGSRHALTCSNGTTALELALRGIGLAAGEDCIVPARTFVATASVVVNCGARPLVADIDPVSLNVTVETLEARRTAKTRAVIVVHYAGRPCDMAAICEWGFRHGIWIIEDAAHGHGATLGGRHVGTFGAVGCFSFCVGKIMSTGGEGGVVVTDDSVLYRRMTQWRDHGRFQVAGNGTWKFDYTVDVCGSNLRMTEMQSAIARCQLRKLDGWVQRRREIASIYDAKLRQRQVVDGHSFYLYLARVNDFQREKVLKECYDVGVRWGGAANILRERAFADYPQHCPVADKTGEQIVALPVYPTMDDAAVMAVVERVTEVLGW